MIDNLKIFQVSHPIRSYGKLKIEYRRISVRVFEPATFHHGLLQGPIPANNDENLTVRGEVVLFAEHSEICDCRLNFFDCVISGKKVL